MFIQNAAITLSRRIPKAIRYVSAAAAVSAAGACASAPPIAEMQTHTACHVWTEGMMGYAAARVDDQAHLYGAFGTVDAAYFVTDSELLWDAPLATAKGTYQNGDLVIHGFMSDIGPIEIGDHAAILEGWLGDALFEFNDRCSDDQAAMGVMSLFVAIESQKSSTSPRKSY